MQSLTPIFHYRDRPEMRILGVEVPRAPRELLEGGSRRMRQMRRTIVALVSAVVAGMMLIPGSVSAKPLSIAVEDRVGDLAAQWDVDTLDYIALYGDTPIVQAGYFDMTWFFFSQKRDTYTFGMEMAADLPKEGDSLPQGVTQAQWFLWLDPEPWDWSPYAFPSYCVIRLSYDGSSYHAGLYTYVPDAPGDEIMELPFSVDGPRFQVKFTADSIADSTGDASEFWLYPCTIAYHGECPLKVWLDYIDPDAGAPGQTYVSIPWPQPEE
jgi:hypothetical protein